MINWEKISANEYRVDIGDESWELYRIKQGDHWWFGTRDSKVSMQFKVTKITSALIKAKQEISLYYETLKEQCQNILDTIK